MTTLLHSFTVLQKDKFPSIIHWKLYKKTHQKMISEKYFLLFANLIQIIMNQTNYEHFIYILS